MHVVIRMCSSDHAHSNHERQLAKIMAEVGSTSSSSLEVSLHDWLEEEFEEPLNDEEINKFV